jgi:hypothetical protein
VCHSKKAGDVRRLYPKKMRKIHPTGILQIYEKTELVGCYGLGLDWIDWGI